MSIIIIIIIIVIFAENASFTRKLRRYWLASMALTILQSHEIRFLTSRGAQVNCAIMGMLYTHAIANQP